MQEPKKVQILHLENDGNDAELVKAALGENPNFSVTQVATRTDFMSQLANNGWDIVLSDKDMPGFDGFEALIMIRGRTPHLPFVFVTGADAPQTVIEAFRKGATDYVLKSQLEDLPSAVTRALKRTSTPELIPICSWCKKIRKGEKWVGLERFLMTTTGISFTHGICPSCKEDYLTDPFGKI